MDVGDEVRDDPQCLALREHARAVLQDTDGFTRRLDDVGRAGAGDVERVAFGLEREIGVVIRVVRRMTQLEDVGVGVLVDRILDRVGPHRGVSKRLIGRQDATDLLQSARAVQMQLGKRPDDAVSGRTERVDREGEARNESGRGGDRNQ